MDIQLIQYFFFNLEQEDSVSSEQLLKMASTSMCKSWKLFGVEFAPLLVPLGKF